MALKVMYAGQDVSLLVKESSIQLQDQLGQGPGVASGSSGRATTLSFLLSGVGPAAGAVGAGTTITPTYKNLLSTNQSSVDVDATGFVSNGNGTPAFSRTTAQYFNGGASLQLTTSANGFCGIKTTAIPAVANTAYTASIYVKAAAGTALQMSFSDATNSVSQFASWTADGSWTRHVLTLTTGVNPVTDLHLSVSNTGTAQVITCYIDALQIEQGATATGWAYGGVSATPKVVRQGEVVVYDSTGTAIFGGYAVVLEDQTVKKTNYVKVSCVDYWQFLDTILVNKVYNTQTDVFIISDLLTTYAPWVLQDQLPASGSLTLSVENFQHFTLQKAIQRVTDKAGYNVWIDAAKHIHYINPTKSLSSPFALSDSPNFTTTFQCGVTDYTVDDSSTINRVYFYGGKSLSNDLTQDLSTQCNGANDLFVLAYYPHKSSDGHFHLKKNGVDVNLGFVGGIGAANTLIRDGGTADALINIDSHTIQWSTAPTAGTTIVLVYRREIPLLVVVSDNSSFAFYGRYLDGVISDSSVFDQSTAVRRCQTLLYEQSYGLETLQIKTWRAGIQAGQIIRVDHAARNIHKSFIVQSVGVKPLGNGYFEYDLTCGAWHINLVDAVMQLARLSTPEDTSSTESESTIAITSLAPNVGMHLAATTQTRTMGMYYPRATPVGDGSDAYPGLFSI